MGWHTYEDVRKHSRLELGDKARLIMIELALCADDETRVSHPGTDRLMQMTRASRPTVFRLLKQICATAEVVQIQRGGGAGRAAEYQLADLAALYGEGLTLDETQEGLTQSDTQARGESVSPRRDAKGSQEGLTRVSPTRARVSALRVNGTPQPPKGGRQRDRDRFAEQLPAWILEHLPEYDAHNARVITAVKQALRYGTGNSPADVRRFLREHWPELPTRDELQATVHAIAALPENEAERAWERLETQVTA